MKQAGAAPGSNTIFFLTLTLHRRNLILILTSHTHIESDFTHMQHAHNTHTTHTLTLILHTRNTNITHTQLTTHNKHIHTAHTTHTCNTHTNTHNTHTQHTHNIHTQFDFDFDFTHTQTKLITQTLTQHLVQQTGTKIKCSNVEIRSRKYYQEYKITLKFNDDLSTSVKII